MSIADKYPDGVTKYSLFNLTVAFPYDNVNCLNCFMCYSDITGRHRCRFTGRMLYDIRQGVGAYCPLEEVNADD